MTPLPILYSFRRCPYAMRARMALIIAAQPCELREVTLKSKPAAMLQASPKGTVPVLQFADGTVIDESLEIMLWAFSQTDDRTWLTPKHGTLEMMLDLIERNDGEFKHHLDRYKYPERYTAEQADPTEHRTAACAFLGELEALLKHGAGLFGPDPSLADIAVFPFIRQFAATDPDWFAGVASPSLQAWLDGWLGSGLFTAAMHKHPVWQPGDSPNLLPGD